MKSLIISASQPLPIFVYGTLRPGGGFFGNIEWNVARHEPARLPGFDLFAGGYPAIRPATSYSHVVVGDLLWMKHTELALRRCDAIECYHPPYSSMYIRAVVTALSNDSAPTAAWAYLAGPGHNFAEGVRVTSGDIKVARPEAFEEVPA